MIINGKEIIIQGQGHCTECGALFCGDPYDTFIAMKKHQVMTGHDVYGNEFHDSIVRSVGDDFVDTVMETT